LFVVHGLGNQSADATALRCHNIQVVMVDGAGNPVEVPVDFTGTAVSGTGSPEITAEGSASGAH
jgi:hypothetical protein